MKHPLSPIEKLLLEQESPLPEEGMGKDNGRYSS